MTTRPRRRPRGAIVAAYEAASKAVADGVAGWTDETLEVEDNMYGQIWTRGMTLLPVVHQTHHRAQMTVLMRQAGLRVPGVYGPSREDWTTYGMQPPAVLGLIFKKKSLSHRRRTPAPRSAPRTAADPSRGRPARGNPS